MLTAPGGHGDGLDHDLTIGHGGEFTTGEEALFPLLFMIEVAPALIPEVPEVPDLPRNVRP